MGLQDTPHSQRLTIGFFGKTNSGKSSILNMLTGQETSVVSPAAGTTTDPVYKAMEIKGLGPVLFIDTAGFDDTSYLGVKRMEKTQGALEKCDIICAVLTPDEIYTKESGALPSWFLNIIETKKDKTAVVLNKTDMFTAREIQNACECITSATNLIPVVMSAAEKKGSVELQEAFMRLMPSDFCERTITGDLVHKGSLVLLVMPQDIQAPKGRLILPQVQVTRELLDKKCTILSCTTDCIDEALTSLSREPDLIITDSQVFKIVSEKKPPKSLLTSFSVLLAANKGSIEDFVQGAKAIEKLTPSSRVLIAEACTHAPLSEDIGREKIPAMLRKKYGQTIAVDIVSGTDFPEDLSPYDLVIHCGGCMFNRTYVLSRQHKAKTSTVPMTNYGITIAFLNGILDEVCWPQNENTCA